jgi:hypothetical protein
MRVEPPSNTSLEPLSQRHVRRLGKQLPCAQRVRAPRHDPAIRERRAVGQEDLRLTVAAQTEGPELATGHGIQPATIDLGGPGRSRALSRTCLSCPTVRGGSVSRPLSIQSRTAKRVTPHTAAAWRADVINSWGRSHADASGRSQRLRNFGHS